MANYLSQMHSAITQPDIFQPARLRYISYDSRNNDFKLLLDKGDIVGNGLKPFPTQQEEAKLFNYFLIGLSLPNDTFWVNLRPDAPENIIDPLLEKTEIGKIFLEADLQLKKDTASLTSPQNPEGKQYWDKLYKKAGELFGTENITIPTITRPWIVPNEVIVRETEDSAYIYKATLKVMLEEDYLRGMRDEGRGTINYSFNDPRLKELNEYSTQLIKETIIPKLTKEINSSKRYAKLRQVYYSLVLSRWFKQKYSSLGSARAPEHQGTRASEYISLIDSGNLADLASQEPYDKQTYFSQYNDSFAKGEYNLKETVALPSGQSIRSYISGGINVTVDASSSLVGFESNNPAVTESLFGGGMLTVVGSPLIEWGKKDVRQDLRKIYNSYSGVQAAIEIIKLFIGGDEKGKNYIKYLEDTRSSLSVFEGVKDLHESLQMAFKIFKEASEHKQRNEKGVPTQAISVELNKKEFLDEFAKLQEKMNRLKENPYRLPWIEEILGQIDLFLYEFNDVSDPEVAIQLREIKREIGHLTSPIDVNKKWIGGAVRGFLVGLTSRKTGNSQRSIKRAVNEIDRIIEDQRKGDDLKPGNISGSPLTELKIFLGNAREVIKGVVDSGSMLSGMFYYLEENGELIERELLLGLVVGLEKQIDNLRNNLKENRRFKSMKQDEQKYYEDKIAQIVRDCDNLISVLEKIVAKQASSAIISPMGGIDFTDRAMRLKIERVGSFADLKLVLPRVQNAQDINLDNEFRQIEAIASSGIVPNSRRILELFSACYSRGEFGRRLPQVISALKSSSAIQEKLAIDSDDDFRLALIVPEALTDGR